MDDNFNSISIMIPCYSPNYGNLHLEIDSQEPIFKEAYLDPIIINRVRKNHVCLDISANIGLNTIKLAKQSGIVYSFEPDSKNYAKLCRHIAANNLVNVIPMNMGLSKDFSISNNILYKTIDQLGLPKVDFIKVGIEDITILEGGIKTLVRCRPTIIFNCKILDHFVEFFKSINYTISVLLESEHNFLATPNERTFEYSVMK